ncbi:MAG: ATP-binding cassette domain-containing protein [Coriobacteriia bacterium]|nr:ATP-binding cassette domain-containing protein [Coriobacteriia bacterium]
MSCKLTYDNVSYTYADGTQALRGVSFELGHGEHVALLGPNGAGKSTIMLLANGIFLPQKGRVTVGDEVVSQKTLVSIRQRVGLVFQDPDDQLFMTTVFDDVAFGLLNQNINSTAHTHTSDGSDAITHTHTHTHSSTPDHTHTHLPIPTHSHTNSPSPDHTHTHSPTPTHTHDHVHPHPHTHGDSEHEEGRKESHLLYQPANMDTHDGLPENSKPRPLSPDELRNRVEQALQLVGLEGLEHKAPHDLSFGQRKRAALATILVMRPDFLILDEPSSNLDPRGRRHMMGLLQMMEHTILLATHDLDLVWELCPRSIIIDEGRIVADGPTHELLRDEQLLVAHGLELPAAVRLR